MRKEERGAQGTSPVCFGAPLHPEEANLEASGSLAGPWVNGRQTAWCIISGVPLLLRDIDAYSGQLWEVREIFREPTCFTWVHLCKASFGKPSLYDAPNLAAFYPAQSSLAWLSGHLKSPCLLLYNVASAPLSKARNTREILRCRWQVPEARTVLSPVTNKASISG